MKYSPENRLAKTCRLHTLCGPPALARSAKVGHTIAASNHYSYAVLLALLTAMGSFGLAERAVAQTVIRDDDTGAVQVDHNAFDIRTGPLENQSAIPLPSELIEETRERLAQPVTRDKLAPNSVMITPDVDFIDDAFNDLLGQDADTVDYHLQTESLQMMTRFNLAHRPGAHAFGEGIQVTVFGPDGTVRSRESAFVRGGGVTIGPDGQPLPTTAELNVTYGADETVELRVLNIRRNGATPTESGIYFSRAGAFVVEDLPNGGDLDFNDGDYVELFGGHGTAQTLEEHSTISYETQIVETPLDPALRQEVVQSLESVENLIHEETVTEEERTWGEVELPELGATRLGHARAAYSEDDELLVYDRYSGAAQARLGSDGLRLAGQLPPLVSNPNVPPTLLTGSATFDPTVDDNEAGLTATVGVTQFLHPTHRVAEDVFGNAIAPEHDPMLLEPTGLFSNRRWVGYVPAGLGERTLGEQLTSVNGIFELPPDQAVDILPPDPHRVGRGAAAYTDNVGGLLLEDSAGQIRFVPQWTANGYSQEPLSLDAGEVHRIIYALVPQQAGQSLMLGQRYEVTDTADGYRITDGNFVIISADRQPQNFLQEMVEVYAVEDTLPGQNATTASFNGIRGTYVETVGGEPIPTVDLMLPGEADARVGNELFPVEFTPPEPGQSGYAETTVAAGLYVGGSFTGGFGNQQDTVTRVTTTVQQAVDEIHVQQTTRTFATPRSQRDTFVFETTETLTESGTASFDINSQGRLTNAVFASDGIQDRNVSQRVADHTRELTHGEEVLLNSVSEDIVHTLPSHQTVVGHDVSTDDDSYPNFAPVHGEIALGGVLNFGNTPWSPAANTVRAEVFGRDVVFGRDDEAEAGWRAELVVHPFGEQRRQAFQYDETNAVVPVYQTEPVLDTTGAPVMETLIADDGSTVEVPVNQFVLDAAGDRIPQTTGTGRPNGPGMYFRVQDLFGDDDGTVLAGGIQFDF